MPSKVTWEELLAFFKEYYTAAESQRFGQAFCNRFNILNPDLFYCNTVNCAMELILKQHIKDCEFKLNRKENEDG